ncbi:Aspartate carbamoyltransferase regulatory chain [Methanoculleus chikugoensis]|jgi:aspartate carbamoyltransferase regulatory subunit|uniref:Aspartate carbamoyltransferase regulatory chain n=1 Tax=Methanoculleus chikugoensis TaxID=118126 RepID=A0A1M4MNH6_9EURY|nr:aspartate carbamoyltransferase regulatory subunit [Methanoculleus chikugoensis]MDD4567331.1 aspartate carbamoyltransferase regulatory subunit [Methanoculleus chikugoensis]NMA11087.1 aspartate carbamoyltransferase regulatory subunit [Methanomicrobiales archaeon]BBL68674.1 aspartate carbamoyltransferase regulatory subunit [Methanoculleus chikugoensis]SCL76348.1 Aspartate carbamoyltransferase regulatory chain [Methanoculleus chikugoensis]
MSRKDPSRGLLVSPIKNGTVIDHITAGEALNVLRILGITGSTRECLSIATNVESKRMGKKDIVKIENRELRTEEVDRIALLAPHAKINIIRDYKVVEKKGVEIPEILRGVVRCPNPGCITNTNEPVASTFEVLDKGLHCLYCDWLIKDDIANHII